MKKSSWVPIVFAAVLIAVGVALFGWPGPARQFLVAQKDWIRSLGAAVAILSAATACVLSLRRHLRRREADKPSAEGVAPVREAPPVEAVAVPAPPAAKAPPARAPEEPTPRRAAPVRAGDRGVAIGGTATNTVIATGDGNVIAGAVSLVVGGERDEPAAGDPAAAARGLGRGSAAPAPAVYAGERAPAAPDRPFEVFISYAHEDESLRAELGQHLSLLVREGWIRPWHDREIAAGDEWRGRIDDRLEAADLILLLVSASFLGSDYCFDLESTRALERHALGQARVIPVIVRPCDWATAPFAGLQALPRGGKPVTTWDNCDEAWLDVARGLRAAIATAPPSRSWC